ncbi:MAG: DUF1501 domain-containing protein [Nannocystaceae bacterium]
MHKLSRRNLILGGSALLGTALADARPTRAASGAPPRKLILMVASGGWDPTYVLDPKPGLSTIDGPSGEIRRFDDIPVFTDASRPAPTAFFEAHASRCQVINGVQTQSIVHADCLKRVLTGTPSDASPDIGAITAFTHARELAAPYLVLGQTSYTGPLASIAARAGTANQIGGLLNPYAGLPAGSFEQPTYPFMPDVTEESLIREYVTARTARETAIRGQLGHNKRRLEDFSDSLWRGDALKNVGTLGELDFTRDLMVQARLALEGLETGLCYAVQIELGGWDTHANNAAQTNLNERLYAGLKYLVDELAARPGENAGSKMIDETVVVVLSEMGRTPKLNAAAGKDHWPVTSAIVLGSGVAGGRVVGASSDELGAVGVDLETGSSLPGGTQLAYGNLAAGILSLVGVDPATFLPNSEPLHALAT